MKYKIPKVIHYVWVGGGEKSAEIERCIASWKKHCPDYEIREWNETNFDTHSNRFVKEAYRQKKWAFVSDYIRVWVIYNYGGIYLDADCLVLSSLDELRRDRAFVGFERNDIPFTACFGAEKKHPLVKKMLDCYSSDRKFGYDPDVALQSLYDKDYFPVNVHEVTKILVNDYNIKLGGKEQALAHGVRVYPANMLCEPSFESKVIHIFTATWGDWDRGAIDRALLVAKSHIKGRFTAGAYSVAKSTLGFCKHPRRSIEDWKLEKVAMRYRTVAVMTFHSYNGNYGSVLQAYALSRVLSILGFRAVFMDYNPYRPVKRFRYRLVRLALTMMRTQWRGHRRTVAETMRFKRRHFDSTRVVRDAQDIASLPQIFEYYIAGSDQIWAANSLDGAFLLSTVASPNKVSYAPSAVVLDYSNEQKRMLRRELSKFKAISVREQAGKDEMLKYVDSKIAVTLDPTLLLTKKQYADIVCRDNPYADKKYLLCFYLPSQKLYEKATMELAEKHGLEVVNISECPNNQFGIVATGASVELFLRLVKDAEVVLTNSYHGALFSLIFERDFYVLSRHKAKEKNNQNTRYSELLGRLKLNDRYVVDDSLLGVAKKIDYKRVGVEIKRQREKSIDYLRNAIGAKGKR